MRFITGVIVMVASVGGSVASQGQPPPPSNLRVLPKDINRGQLTQLMQSFRVALGVECTHCHLPMDRASDEKPTKLLARKMLQMTIAINNEYMKDVGEPAPASAPGAPPAAAAPKVTCYTCHRGVLKPLTAPGGGQ